MNIACYYYNYSMLTLVSLPAEVRQNFQRSGRINASAALPCAIMGNKLGGTDLSGLIRFGISMEKELLQRLDQEIVKRGYPNRSEAIRNLIRNQLVEIDWSRGDEEVAGTITIIYNHHVKGLSDLLLELQHRHHGMIVSVMHVHLEHEHCLEVMVIKGKAAEARDLADRLIGVKGVKHGKLTISSTGAGLK